MSLTQEEEIRLSSELLTTEALALAEQQRVKVEAESLRKEKEADDEKKRLA